MNALARAIATATPSATRATSDVAKTREEKGREGTTPHHKAFVVAGSQDQRLTQLRAAATRGPRGVLPVIGLGDDTDSIQHLDFHPECDGRKGECHNAADYLVGHRCAVCAHENPERVAYACEPCWVDRSQRQARCRKCLSVYPHGAGWRIKAVLR